MSFKYDPFGRRIYKSSSTATSVYAYDGDNLVEETNASGAVVARYSQGLNIDEPFAMLRSSALLSALTRARCSVRIFAVPSLYVNPTTAKGK